MSICMHSPNINLIHRVSCASFLHEFSSLSATSKKGRTDVMTHFYDFVVLVSFFFLALFNCVFRLTFEFYFSCWLQSQIIWFFSWDAWHCSLTPACCKYLAAALFKTKTSTKLGNLCLFHHIDEQVKAVAEEMGIGFLGIGFQPKWGLKDIPIMPKVLPLGPSAIWVWIVYMSCRIFYFLAPMLC